MHRVRRRPAACALLSAALACGRDVQDPEPTWCPFPDGAQRVVAPSGGRDLTLREEWRRGGLREGEDLAYPLAPAVSPDGWIAIPDVTLGTVFVADSSGSWLGPVTRVGQGPGETRMPVAAVWQEDGLLAILDVGNLAVLRLEAPGFSLREQVGAPERLLGEAFASGELPAAFLDELGRVGVELPRRREAAGARLWTGFALEAADGAVDTLVTIRTVPLFPDARFGNTVAPGYPVPIAVSGPGGAIAVAGDGPRYRIRVLASDLTDSLVICRDSPAPPLTRRERGDTALPPVVRLLERLRELPEPDALLPLGRVFFGAGGELWVQRARPDPLDPGRPPGGSAYDLFAPGGWYLGTVTAPPRTSLQGQAGDLVIGYETGALDETSVVAYRLVGAALPP